MLKTARYINESQLLSNTGLSPRVYVVPLEGLDRMCDSGLAPGRTLPVRQTSHDKLSE